MTKRSPLSVRYLKARLKVLQRPTVWGSVLVLSLPLIFLMDYWSDPEQFVTADRTSEALSDASSSDATAPAVSDPSTILDALTVPAVPDQTTGQPTLAQLQPSLLSTLLAESSTASSKPPQARTSAASDLARRSQVNRPDAFPSITAPETNSGSAGDNTTEPPASPLQSALDRNQSPAGNQASSDHASTSASSSSQVNPPSASQNLPWLRSTAQNSPIQSGGSAAQPYSAYSTGYPTGAIGSGALYSPQTSPYPGTTGYTLPPSFRTPSSPSYANPTYSQMPFAPATLPATAPNAGYGNPSDSNSYRNPYSSPYSSPGYSNSVPSYPTPGFASPQPPAQPAPFSVPRTSPGRYIGNGEINTFSNP